MAIERERIAVVAMYPKSRGWKVRVSLMPDHQVLAIYFRNLWDKPKSKEEQEPDYNQGTLF